MINKPKKGTQSMEERYWKEVSKLLDDTGYFDHEFVLRFLRKEVKKANIEGYVKAIKDFRKIIGENPDMVPSNELDYGEFKFREYILDSLDDLDQLKHKLDKEGA